MVSAKICHGFSFIYIVMMLIWSLIDADENFTLDGVPSDPLSVVMRDVQLCYIPPDTFRKNLLANRNLKI